MQAKETTMMKNQSSGNSGPKVNARFASKETQNTAKNEKTRNSEL